MPIVNFFGLQLPPDKAEQAEADVILALTNAVDIGTQPINATVVSEFDAVLLDALFANPLAEMCPYIGVNTWVARGTDAQGGHEVRRNFNFSFYFIYYIGNLATFGPTPVSFKVQRDRHIEACMKAIEMQSGGNPTATITYRHGWKWATEQAPTYDYFSPFRYINESFKMPSEFNCVRVDKPAAITFSR